MVKNTTPDAESDSDRMNREYVLLAGAPVPEDHRQVGRHDRAAAPRTAR
jgi:hypothetical protein